MQSPSLHWWQAPRDDEQEQARSDIEVPILSDDEQEEHPEVEITPKIILMHPDNSKVAKPFSLQIKRTPAKRAKDSDSEDDLDQGVSPVKKMKKTLPAKKSVIPLPRRQTATAKKGPTTPSKQKVQVVIEARTSPTKRTKAPDSSSAFFVEDTKDEVKARRQHRLFGKDVLSSKAPHMDDDSSAEDSKQGSDEDVEMVDSSRSGNEAAMSKLVNDMENKLVLDIDNPEVVDPNLKATYKDLPPVWKCEAITSESAIHTVLYTSSFLNRHDINRKAFYNLVTLTEEKSFVINPARYDPACVEPATYGNSSNKVISLPTLGKQNEHAICMSIGFTYSCDIIHPKSFSKPGSSTPNYVKSILFGPMLTEWKRTVGFFGTVFGVDKISVGTFTAGGRYVGVNVHTFPSEPASDHEFSPLCQCYTRSSFAPVPDLPFIQATPTKRAPKKNPSMLSHSLLEMRDKMTWSANDDIAIWDATQYFKKSKAPSKQFTFNLLPTLPRMTADLTFGDIVIVFYSVSSYNRKNGMGLSLNLCGVMLVSCYQK
ncbi:hypothetical protein BV20DRAFT_982997 [Pilatotrama ljubarskyi]|nr:hypothetical protein BV20DRAFT_982997 [Pilatotrama ljubarskyi]